MSVLSIDTVAQLTLDIDTDTHAILGYSIKLLPVDEDLAKEYQWQIDAQCESAHGQIILENVMGISEVTP